MNATMQRNRTKKRSFEDRMLDAIVDAMLDAQQDLRRAGEADRWSQILVDACRRRKDGTAQVPMVTSC